MRWEPFSDEALLDPFCGSGTIPIEAAMIAASMPAGLNRRFTGRLAGVRIGSFCKST